MRVHEWQSFSSNNSSHYRLVARFESAEVARTVAGELRVFLRQHAEEIDSAEEFDPERVSEAQRTLAAKHGFEWDSFVYWGDEGLTGDEPTVGVARSTVVLYHTYCGGFEALTPYLNAVGGRLEDEQGEWPTVAARIRLPAGDAGRSVREALQAFFGQAESGASLESWKVPPP